jgi:hypothetical protein
MAGLLNKFETGTHRIAYINEELLIVYAKYKIQSDEMAA